jgi:O-antigen ligase
MKFGNPVILASQIKPPGDIWEFLIAAWPLAWSQPLLALLCIWGAITACRSHGVAVPINSPHGHVKWLVWLPLIWLTWQCASAAQTVSWPLTLSTLKHFAAATACFYLGFLVLGRAPDLTPMWGGVLVGFIGVVAVGFDQHFGGLEATRKYFYSQPGWQHHSPDLLRKIASTRIYSTLFYPNTLAGVILVFLPILMSVSLQLSCNLVRRTVLAGCISFSGIACLLWSGSKAGWLIGLAVALMAWFTSKANPRLKWSIGIAAAIVGLGAFLGRHFGYFERGASSMGARLDYWSVALGIAGRHPILGSGPGTFGVLYRYLKSPDSEMARMVHNDYLEQASDSGAPGFILFFLFTLGLVAVLGRHLIGGKEMVTKSIWLGLVGWAMQGFVEFGLYIPALAWPAFLFLGYLASLPQGFGRNEVDNPNRVG